jgi:phosphomannomutase
MTTNDAFNDIEKDNYRIQLKSSADGWRGIINETFTIDSLQRLALRIAQTFPLHAQFLIAHDGRFYSQEGATAIVEKLKSSGYKAILVGMLATPVVSYAVKKWPFSAGLIVTASHNPFYFNGLKLKCGSAVDTSALVPSEFNHDFIYTNYSQDLLAKFPTDLINTIKTRKFKVAVDCLHGVASRMFISVLAQLNCQLTLLGDNPDPLFNGILPDPTIPASRERLVTHLKQHHEEIGFITDGDGDRLIVLDQQGKFIWPHDILGMILDMLLQEDKTQRGAAITVSTGSIVQRIAHYYQRPCYETSIGFKHIIPYLADGRALMGGGPVGEFALSDYSLDRDPMIGIILLLAAIAQHQTPINDFIHTLHTKFGKHFYGYWTYSIKLEDKTAHKKLLQQLINKIHWQDKIMKTIELDGIKVHFNNGSWILLRNGTTEDCLRLYVDAINEEDLSYIRDHLAELIGSPPIEKA